MPLSKNYVYARNSGDARRRASAKYSSKVVVSVTLTRDVHGKPVKYAGKKRYDVKLRARKR